MYVAYDCHLMLRFMTQKILTYLTHDPINLGMSIPFVYDHQHALFVHSYLPFTSYTFCASSNLHQLLCFYAVFKPLFLLCAHNKTDFHRTTCSTLNMDFMLMLHKICNILEQASKFLIYLFLS